MRKRIPNTEIYLDTSDFYFSSTPNETEIEMSARFIVSEDRDGSSKEQTISGTLSITNNLNVTNKLTCGSFEITESELTVKHLSVSSDSSNDIWLKVSDFGKLYTPTIYSVFVQGTNENAYAKINLQKYSSSDPSKIEFVIPRRESSSYRNSTYTMTKDGFYCVDSNNASTSLGTISNHWSKAYIDTGNIQTLQPNNTSNTSEIKDFSSIQGALLKGTTIEGTVSSLYNITQDSVKIQGKEIYYGNCDPGALFIASNYPLGNPPAGCMTIRIESTDFYLQDWPFNGKRLRIGRGEENLSILSYHERNQNDSNDSSYWYVDTDYRIITSVSGGKFVYSIIKGVKILEISIAYIRSNPLLYNSDSIYVPTYASDNEDWAHDYAIDISKWNKLAFFQEVLFDLPTWYTDEDYPVGKEIESADFAYPRSIMVMRVS